MTGHAHWLRLVCLIALALGAPSILGIAHAQTIDLRSWVLSWPDHYAVSGKKFELAYIQAIDIRRDGNVFSVTGGAPSWIERWTQTVTVSPAGVLENATCGTSPCAGIAHPSGYLASATMLALARTKKLTGHGDLRQFGSRQVVCVPGEVLGFAQPLLDPCFDRTTGAVLAQWQRTSGRFDGPSLNPATVRVIVDDGKATAASN